MAIFNRYGYVSHYRRVVLDLQGFRRLANHWWTQDDVLERGPCCIGAARGGKADPKKSPKKNNNLDRLHLISHSHSLTSTPFCDSDPCRHRSEVAIIINNLSGMIYDFLPLLFGPHTVEKNHTPGWSGDHDRRQADNSWFNVEESRELTADI